MPLQADPEAKAPHRAFRLGVRKPRLAARQAPIKPLRASLPQHDYYLRTDIVDNLCAYASDRA